MGTGTGVVGAGDGTGVDGTGVGRGVGDGDGKKAGGRETGGGWQQRSKVIGLLIAGFPPGRNPSASSDNRPSTSAAEVGSTKSRAVLWPTD